jgi:hypothetical protein
MKDHRIIIYIKKIDAPVYQIMLSDFFGIARTPVYPIYIRFNKTEKHIQEERIIRATFSRPQVVEASEDENIGFTPLAHIITQPYPSHLVVFIEGIAGQEKNWSKVENLVKKIFSQMELMKFEIESVMPASLLPKSAFPVWEQIEDRASDRIILKLWHEQRSAKAIAQKISLSPDTVRNTLTALRTKYGEGIVPYAEQQKKKSV